MRPTLLTVICLFLASPALASDGVLEINQTCAVETGCFVGDTPGFPVTIPTAGSYVLTGSLNTPASGTLPIEIAADRVTLDLNGHTVGICIGVICGITGSADAIKADAASGVRIHNGTIEGALGACIHAGSQAMVRDLHVEGCANGIVVGAESRIHEVTVTNSGQDGIHVGQGSLIESSVVTGSGGDAVVADQSLLLVDSLIRDNQGAIAGVLPTLFSHGGYRGCVITANGPAEEQPISLIFRDLGGNFCGSDTVCP
jgi:hypothetical protein